MSWARRNTLDFFPLRHSLRGYTREAFRGDARAGLNVALLAFPQGMAYAAIAGLPIEYGVFGSAIAALFGPILGGSRFIVHGPTNATAVLLFSSWLSLGIMDPAERVALVPLIVFLAGLFLVIGAFLKVANLVQFISRSVVTGYITAAAFYIVLNQFNKVLGYTTFNVPKGATFLDVVWLTLSELGQTHWPTLLLSAATVGIYALLSHRYPRLPNVAITLVALSLAAFGLNALIDHQGWQAGPVALLTAINPSDWTLTLPPLRSELISQLANIGLLIAFLSVLEGMSIGRSLAARAGERLDANQEMLGMGLANIGCAFLKGVPASGSLTRSQLNYTSGAQTPLASILCGVFLTIVTLTLGSLTAFIPKSVLAVLVIAIGLSLLNRHVLRVVIKSTRSDAIVFFTTFITALLVRLDFAIILGTITSIVLFLRKVAVPELVEYGADASGDVKPLRDGESSQPSISIVHVEGELFFGATELFRDQLRRVSENPNLCAVVLKMRNAHNLDATSILALEELHRSMREKNRYLLISEARKDAIRIFRNSGFIHTLGRDNLFPDNPRNPTLSTARALRRASQLLGDTKAEINIFLGTQRKGASKNKGGSHA